MQDLNEHIHESDAKSSDDKQEVADETIEKILPNLEIKEIQMQDLSKFSPGGRTQVDENDLLTTKRSKKEEIPMRKLHKNACQICGSTFQTVQEITKHIAGNLHDIRAFLY